MSVVGGPWHFFKSAATSGDSKEIPRCRSDQFNYFISKTGENFPRNHVFIGFFFHFQVAKFRHHRKKNSTLECAEYVVAITTCLKKNR